jgi:transposase
VIGIDLAKRVFQLCALSASGEVVWEKRLKRAAFMKFWESAPRVTVGMEACGGAHHWGRWLERRGFVVKLLPPKAVKAYRTGVHKNDSRDARAVAEATSRRYLAAVPVKSEAAQAAQATMRMRERRIRQLVQTANQLRGLLNEFGFILPKGHTRVLAGVAELMASSEFVALPLPMQEVVRALHGEIAEQAGKVKAATAAVAAAVAADPNCALLMTVPNLGPINAAALSIALDVPGAFRNGRAFAAALRLVPRQDASAERSTLRSIGRLHNSELRRYLVLAAQGLLTRVDRMKEPPRDPLFGWAQRMLRRKMRNVAVVALAGKLARIAWAVRASGRPYTPRAA